MTIINQIVRDKKENLFTTLVENYPRFHSFLMRRINDPTDTEEILQSAFTKTLEKSDTIRNDQSIISWFYRLLRNAVIDYYRHRDAERRARVRQTNEFLESILPESIETQSICKCIKHVMPTLKKEYVTLLNRVDLEEVSIAEVSVQMGLTTNNTRVKLHRARSALKKQLERYCGECCTIGHCLDCGCRYLQGSKFAPGSIDAQ